MRHVVGVGRVDLPDELDDSAESGEQTGVEVGDAQVHAVGGVGEVVHPPFGEGRLRGGCRGGAGQCTGDLAGHAVAVRSGAAQDFAGLLAHRGPGVDEWVVCLLLTGECVVGGLLCPLLRLGLLPSRHRVGGAGLGGFDGMTPGDECPGCGVHRVGRVVPQCGLFVEDLVESVSRAARPIGRVDGAQCVTGGADARGQVGQRGGRFGDGRRLTADQLLRFFGLSQVQFVDGSTGGTGDVVTEIGQGICDAVGADPLRESRRGIEARIGSLPDVLDGALDRILGGVAEVVDRTLRVVPRITEPAHDGPPPADMISAACSVASVSQVRVVPESSMSASGETLARACGPTAAMTSLLVAMVWSAASNDSRL